MSARAVSCAAAPSASSRCIVRVTGRWSLGSLIAHSSSSSEHSAVLLPDRIKQTYEIDHGDVNVRVARRLYDGRRVGQRTARAFASDIRSCQSQGQVTNFVKQERTFIAGNYTWPLARLYAIMYFIALGISRGVGLSQVLLSMSPNS